VQRLTVIDWLRFTVRLGEGKGEDFEEFCEIIELSDEKWLQI
jgi:hypothetical protein